jgi:LmbE family N-acetylglucosaminyl deacetylase
LIVAHPDDDAVIASYLARAVFDEHRRVAVVYATRGDAGGNLVGMEQGSTLGEVREMESRQALAGLGISNVWFLRGPDTPGQDVLHSLEAWHHGAALDSIVRFVRLTRPEVVISMLPMYVVGENHDDHQAAAVLATEAFDLAADAIAFPEQVSAPRKRDHYGNYGEGLTSWQPKKLYFFDADGYEAFTGTGPKYNATEVSPSKGVAYATFKERALKDYATQNEWTAQQLAELASSPVQFIFGKSVVQHSVTGDIFEGITAGAVPYRRPTGYVIPTRQPLSMELGGPWAFYRDFWPAHDLHSLMTLLGHEAGIGPGEALWVPLLIHNDTPTPQLVKIRANLPRGWDPLPGNDLFLVAPYATFPVQLTLSAPKGGSAAWQELSWSAEVDGQKLSDVRLRVFVAEPNGTPQ